MRNHGEISWRPGTGHRPSRAVAFFALASIAWPANAQEPSSSEQANRIPDVREHVVHSEHVGEDYLIRVRLPDGYETASHTYPVVYVLDAEKSLGLVGDVTDWLSWAGEIPNVIVVGISYGEDRRAWWRKRSRDLTPWPDRGKVWGEWPLAGGAEAFRSFLETELFPLIGRIYRTTGDRALVGISFGGLFGAYDLLAEDRLFHRYLLVSPALIWDRERTLRIEAATAATRHDLPAIVYSAVGGLDEPEITEPWERWNDQLLSRGYPGLVYTPERFEGETHISVFPAAVTRGLKTIFGTGIPASRTGTQAAAILDRFRRLMHDFSAESDPEAAADLYVSAHTEDAVLMVPGLAPIRGREAIRPFIADFARRYEFRFDDWTSEELVVSGDIAIHRFSGVAELVPRVGGDSIRQPRKYLDVWRRSADGEWRIARHIFNGN